MAEIQRLKYFLEVSRQLHFSKAARRLGTSQPNLTRQIRALEASVGEELFDRDKRKVELSEAGVRLIPLAEQIVGLAESLRGKVKRPESQKMIRIGHIPAALFSIIPKEMRALQKLAPACRYTLSEGFPPQLLRALLNSNIDLAFSLGPPEGNLFSSRSIWSTEYQIALPPNHVASKKKGTSLLRDLLDLNWITIPNSSRPAPEDPLLSYMESIGFTSTKRVVVETQQAIMGYVAAGQGFALLPSWLSTMASRAVTFKRVSDPLPKFTVFAIWRRTETDPDLLRIIRHRFERY